MKEKLRILLVDDDEEEYLLLQTLIRGNLKDIRFGDQRKTGFELHWVDSYHSALEEFRRDAFDAYLVDYRLGGANGLELIKEAIRLGCNAPLIMLTGQGNYEVDLAAMQQGASDYLVKGQLTAPLLERSIRYAIEQKQTEKELEQHVQERTQELAASRDQLAQANVELRAINEELALAKYELETKVAERTAELKRQADELQALHQATVTLLNTLDLEDLLNQIIQAAHNAIPTAEHAHLYMQDSDDDPHQEWLSQVLHERRPILWVGALEGNHNEGSCIGAPLLLGEKCIGALSLTASCPDAFDEADLRLLNSFATTVTAAIRNARLYDQVQKLSITDPLTGLYNRRGLFALSEHEIKQAKRFNRTLSLILFDLDHFKDVNDTFGHAVGDEVLQEIAQRVQNAVRSVDILARHGGEEFALLLPECSLNNACDLAERLRFLVSDPAIETQRGPVKVTISLGVAEANTEARDLLDMLERADVALYEAKQRGRNRTEVYR